MEAENLKANKCGATPRALFPSQLSSEEIVPFGQADEETTRKRTDLFVNHAIDSLRGKT